MTLVSGEQITTAVVRAVLAIMKIFIHQSPYSYGICNAKKNKLIKWKNKNLNEINLKL